MRGGAGPLVAGVPTVPQPSAAKWHREAGWNKPAPTGKSKLSVTAGRYDDGTLRRVFRSIEAPSDRAAAVALASFVTEVKATPQPSQKQDRVITVDAAVEQFLTEHLWARRAASRRR